jgi:hypothetical protein
MEFGDNYIVDQVNSIGREWGAIRRGLYIEYGILYSTDKRVQERYDRILWPRIKHIPLTQEESDAVLAHVIEVGERNWAELGLRIGRSARRVERHWRNALKRNHPELVPGGLAAQEESVAEACIQGS